MNLIPPAVIDMRFPTGEGRHFHLWLPLFLLWPLLWVLELLVFVPAVLFDALLLFVGRTYHHYSLLLLNCFGLLGDARGLVVAVRRDGTDIDMKFV